MRRRGASVLVTITEVADHVGATTMLEEIGEQAFRRIARRKLKERGFDGDIDVEIDRLLRHGVPGFRWPECFLEGN
jgi:hypothetical protein